MKRLFFTLLIIIYSFSAFSQAEPFRIDSIPSQGILLDKGWKFHAGDNPDFANPDFDDSQWESIDPTKDVMDLKQFGNSKIGWFRLTLNVDSSLLGQTFALAVKQTGSSKIIINSVLVKQIGEFSTRTTVSEGYDPAGLGYRLTFGSESAQVIAVKFEKSNFFLLKHIFYPNDCLNLRLIQIESIINNYEYNYNHDIIGFNFGYINAGIYFIIALLHLILFIANKKSIANLVLCIYTFFVSLLHVLANFSFYPTTIDSRNNISMFILTFYPILSFSAFYAFYKLFEIKNDLILKVLIIFAIFSTLILYSYYDWGYIIGTHLMPLINATFLYIISNSAYKNGDKAAKIISVNVIFGILLIIVALVFQNFLKRNHLSPLYFHVSYNIGSLLQSGSIIYYFAYHFNRNWRNLQNQLVEVQQLSLDKQETLQRQNSELQAALLKGQTTERQRVAIDLHDNLGSTISSIKYSLEAIDRSKMNEDEVAVQENLYSLLDKAYNDVRLLSHNLLPEEFEKKGLTETLTEFIRKINKASKIKFDLKIDENFGRQNHKIEFELYSICMELVNNIMKHSKATQAMIRLRSSTDGSINLTVSDNGIGIFKNESDGKGMKNVQARVDSINGKWAVKAIEGEGVENEILV